MDASEREAMLAASPLAPPALRVVNPLQEFEMTVEFKRVNWLLLEQILFGGDPPWIIRGEN